MGPTSGLPLDGVFDHVPRQPFQPMHKPEGFGSCSPAMARQGFGGRAYPGVNTPIGNHPKPEGFGSAYPKPLNHAGPCAGAIWNMPLEAESSRGESLENKFRLQFDPSDNFQ